MIRNNLEDVVLALLVLFLFHITNKNINRIITFFISFPQFSIVPYLFQVKHHLYLCRLTSLFKILKPWFSNSCIFEIWTSYITLNKFCKIMWFGIIINKQYYWTVYRIIKQFFFCCAREQNFDSTLSICLTF